MNKTIIINISGIIFHIEEDAYEVLKVYINDVKRHFANSRDSFEIITDIENRIAELFTEKLKADNKQVVVLSDVEEVIAKMGKVSDFDIDENPQEFTSTTSEPAGAAQPKVKRRLFRDADNQIIGGVCAGLGNYLEIDPTWVRLIWALLFLLKGFGLLIYLIFWIAVPKAETIADKMAMKGEAATLASIKKVAADKITEVKNCSGLKSFFDRFFDILGSVIKWILKAFVIIIGVGIITAAVAAILTVVTGSSALVFTESFGLRNISPFNLVDPAYRLPIIVSVFVLVLVPAIFIIWLGIKILLNRSFFNKTAGLVMLAAWIIALFIFAIYGGRSVAGFKEEASISQTLEITPVKNNTWYLNADDKKWFNEKDSSRYNITVKSSKSITCFHDDFNWDKVSLRIEKSPDNKPHLIKIYKSKGKSFDNAIENAQNILYNYKQKDSTLAFNRHYELKNSGLWRFQEVELILQLPVNSKVVVENGMSSIMRDPYYNECPKEQENENETSFHTWLVTENGIKCENGVDPTSFERTEDLDNLLKEIARDALNDKLESADAIITINSDYQNIDEISTGIYKVTSLVAIKKGNMTISEPYEVLLHKRKEARDPYQKDSWTVYRLYKTSGESF